LIQFAIDEFLKGQQCEYELEGKQDDPTSLEKKKDNIDCEEYLKHGNEFQFSCSSHSVPGGSKNGTKTYYSPSEGSGKVLSSECCSQCHSASVIRKASDEKINSSNLSNNQSSCYRSSSGSLLVPTRLVVDRTVVELIKEGIRSAKTEEELQVLSTDLKTQIAQEMLTTLQETGFM
jgi:hypothetical protein